MTEHAVFARQTDAPTVAFDPVQMLNAALSAPSGDNCQPWRFRLHEHGFEVWHQPARSTSLLDPGGLASRLSLGALLEATKLNAQKQGLHAEWAIDPEPTEPKLWARVRFTRRPVELDPLGEMLFARHTNRHRFDGAPLLGFEQQTLVEGSNGTVKMLRARAAIRCAARLAREAESIRSLSRPAHVELHQWLRWSRHRAQSTRDGLDVRTLGLNWAQWFALKITRTWSIRRLALGLATATGAYAESLVNSASGVGLITVQPGADAVSGGSTLERVWLKATQLGLAFSPMAALPLLIASAEHSPEAFATRHRAALGQLKRQLTDLFALSPTERPVFMFRVGHAKPMAVRALRLDARQLID